MATHWELSNANVSSKCDELWEQFFKTILTKHCDAYSVGPFALFQYLQKYTVRDMCPPVMLVLLICESRTKFDNGTTDALAALWKKGIIYNEIAAKDKSAYSNAFFNQPQHSITVRGLIPRNTTRVTFLYQDKSKGNINNILATFNINVFGLAYNIKQRKFIVPLSTKNNILNQQAQAQPFLFKKTAPSYAEINMVEDVLAHLLFLKEIGFAFSEPFLISSYDTMQKNPVKIARFMQNSLFWK